LANNKYSAIIREANTDKGSQFYANKYNDKGEKGKCAFEKFLKEKDINHISSRRNHPQTNGKNERWFRTYKENRGKFKSFNEFIEWYNGRLHLGLSRTEAITPKDAIMFKLQPSSILGLFFKENQIK
jgi:putative transposase